MVGGGAGQSKSPQSCLVSSLADSRESAGSQQGVRCQECSRSVREPVSVPRPLRDMEKEKFSTAMARSGNSSVLKDLLEIMFWIKSSVHARF